MKHTIQSHYLYIILLSVTLFSSCTDEEPFDIILAQKQMAGNWKCIEKSNTAGATASYQITLSASGVTGVYISNLANLGTKVTVNAFLLDENNILIPTQTTDGYTIEGEGTIKKYKEMDLRFSYSYGTTRAEVQAQCDKIVAP